MANTEIKYFGQAVSYIWVVMTIWNDYTS
jgi:hypothetical protein